jgi:methionyl-tRNA formyltransferase
MSTPRTIFFGTPEFATPSLIKLIEGGFNVVAVVTSPDELTGRKNQLAPSAIKVLAQEKGLKVLQPSSLKSDEFFEEFKKIQPDVCVIVAYGKIIPQRYLDIPRYGFVNIHPSLLPKYRGPSPIQSAILNGEIETGVTIMKIDAEMDHGPIISNTKYQISNHKYYPEIEKELALIGADLLLDVLPKYLDNSVVVQEQDHNQATYCKKYERQDGHIDWSKTTEQIYNQIRALNPNPGVWTSLNGKTLNIFKAEIATRDSQDEVIREKDKLLIRTGNDKYISPTLLQLEGKKMLPAKDFLNGLRDSRLLIE